MREIKYVYDRVNESAWYVKESEKLSPMSFDLIKLLDYMRENDYFFDDSKIEIYYVEEDEDTIKQLLNKLHQLYDESAFIDEDFKNMTSEEFEEFEREQFELDIDFDDFEEYLHWAIDNFGAWG